MVKSVGPGTGICSLLGLGEQGSWETLACCDISYIGLLLVRLKKMEKQEDALVNIN